MSSTEDLEKKAIENYKAAATGKKKKADLGDWTKNYEKSAGNPET